MQVSLYPYVMKYRPYPLGHPVVLTRERLLGPTTPDDSDGAPVCPQLPWSRPDQNVFTGFLLCRVLPPRAQQLQPPDRPPVLPMRTLDDRLVFPLCKQCADLCEQRRPCRHSDAQRSWIAGYTHFELNRALAVGYQVVDRYEVSAQGMVVRPAGCASFRCGILHDGRCRARTAKRAPMDSSPAMWMAGCS